MAETFEIFKKGKPKTIEFSGSKTGMEPLLTNGLVRQAPLFRDRLFPSNSAECPRQGAAGFMFDKDYIVDLSPSSTFYFHIGDAIQAAVEEALKGAGLFIAREWHLTGKELVPNFKVSGRADIIIRDNKGELALVEVKSCGKLPEQPKRNHEAQAVTYALLSGLDKVYVLYISRTPATFDGRINQVWFEIEIDQAKLLKVARILATGLVFGEAKILPAPPASIRPSSDVCTYCPLKTYCWEGKSLSYLRNRETYAPEEVEDLYLAADKIAKMVLAARPQAREKFLKKVTGIEALKGM